MSTFAKDLLPPDISEEEFEIQKESAKASMADTRLSLLELDKWLEEESSSSSAREPRRATLRLRKPATGTKTRKVPKKPAASVSGPSRTKDRMTRPVGREVSRVRWLWDGRIPLGAVTILAGKRDMGKTTILCHLVAQVTTGTLPGELKGVPADVLHVFTEDSEQMTIVPRLIAADADLDRVRMLDEAKFPKGFVLSECLEELRSILEKNPDMRMVVLDPLSGVLTVRQRDSGGAEMRLVLQEVAKLADEFGVAVVCNAHFRKASDSDVLDRIMGSSEMVNVVRSVMAVAKYDGDEFPEKVCLLSQEKNNLGRGDLPGLLYRFVPEKVGKDAQDGSTVTAPRIDFFREIDRTVGDISRDEATGATQSHQEGSVQWLRQLLEDEGSIAAAEAVKAGAPEFSRATVYRAAKFLKVVSSTDPKNHKSRIWSLPSKP